jgi:hypothetical protein
MTDQSLPKRTDIRLIPDTERLDNGVTVLRCGSAREAIRAPYPLGIAAYAYQRWLRGPLGDVIAHRRQYVYFLVPPGTGKQWDTLLDRAGCVGLPLRLLGERSIIVMPTAPQSRAVRWLRGPRLGPARAQDVLTSLCYANERLTVRGATRIRDQQAVMVMRWLAALGHVPRPAIDEAN